MEGLNAFYTLWPILCLHILQSLISTWQFPILQQLNFPLCCRLCVIWFVIFQCVSRYVSVLWSVRGVYWNMSRQRKQFRNKCLSWFYPVVAGTVPALLSLPLAPPLLLVPIKSSHKHSWVLTIIRWSCLLFLFFFKSGCCFRTWLSARSYSLCCPTLLT